MNQFRACSFSEIALDKVIQANGWLPWPVSRPKRAGTSSFKSSHRINLNCSPAEGQWDKTGLGKLPLTGASLKRAPFSLLPKTDICLSRPFLFNSSQPRTWKPQKNPIIQSIRIIIIISNRKSGSPTPVWSDFWKCCGRPKILGPREVLVFSGLLQRAFCISTIPHGVIIP